MLHLDSCKGLKWLYCLHSSCKSISCLNPCQLGIALDSMELKYDDRDGVIEHACGVADYFMNNTSCSAFANDGKPTKRLGIAIVNSDLHGHFSSEKWISNCKTKFR